MRPYHRFRRLTALLVFLLQLSLITDFATFAASILDYLVLHKVKLGSGDWVVVADPARVEEVWSIAAWAQLGVHVPVILLTLFWVRQANASARALGAKDFTFSPNWSVFWFFVPLFNLWKPVHAMAEIWSASVRGSARWRMEELSRAFAVWWPLFIVVNLTGRSAARHWLWTPDPATMVIANRLTLLSDGLSILLTISFLWIVRDIQWGQKMQWQARIERMLAEPLLRGTATVPVPA